MRRRVGLLIEGRGGQVTSSAGDTWLATFGVPHVSSSDALDAISAALDVERLCARAGSSASLRSAVATGDCFVELGSNGSISIAGTPVDRARLLMRHAPDDGVRADVETVRSAGAGLTAGPLQDVVVPGEGSFSAAKVLAVHETAEGQGARALPLIGRAAEVEELQRVFMSATTEQQAHRLLILGPPGVGKTHLVRHLRDDMASSSRVVDVRCTPQRSRNALHPFAGAIATVCDVARDEGYEDAERKIMAVVGERNDAEVVSRALLSLLDLYDGDVPVETLVYGVRAWLESLEPPVIVNFEDLHWGQEAFVDALDHILGRWSRGSALFLGTARPEFLDVYPHWAAAGATSSVIRLREMTRDDLRAIAEHVLDPEPPSTSLVDKLARVSKGNPLFAVETLTMLHASERLIDEGDGLDIAGDDVSLPDSLRTVITARADALSETELSILRRIAVVGERVDVSLLAGSLEDELRASMQRSLSALVSKEMIDPIPGDRPGEDAYSFRHSLIRDVVYDTTPRSERSSGHEVVARALSGAPSFDEAILGQHLIAAGRDLGAIDPLNERIALLMREGGEHLVSAGLAALATGDVRTARTLLTDALEVLPPGDDLSVQGTFALGRALLDAGDSAEAKIVLEDLNERSRNDAVRARCRAEWIWVRLRSEPLGTGEMTRLSDEALQLVGELAVANDHAGVACAYQCAAERHWDALENEKSERMLRLALRHAEVAGDRRSTNSLRAEISGTIFWGPTPVEVGIERCNDLLATIVEDLAAQVQIRSNIALLEAMRGNIDSARRTFGEVREVLDDMGQVVRAGATYQKSGVAELTVGDDEKAAEEFRRGIAVLESLGDETYRRSTLSFLARSLYRLGAYVESEQAIEEARALSDRRDEWIEEWGGLLAKLEARRGKHEAADSLIAATWTALGSSDDLRSRGDVLMDKAEVLRLRDDPAGAVAVAEEAKMHYARKGAVTLVSQAERFLGDLRS